MILKRLFSLGDMEIFTQDVSELCALMELDDLNQTYELKKQGRRHVEALINFIGME